MSGSEDGNLTDFINITDEGDGNEAPLANTSNPVNVVGLTTAIVGGMFTQILLGLMQIVDAFETFVIMPIEGATEFIGEVPQRTLRFGWVDGTGLIDALFGPFIMAAYDAWQGVNAGRYGLASLLVMTALVLGSLWIVVRTAAYIRERGVV